VSRNNGSYILQIEKPKLITKRHVVSGIITTNLFSDVLVSNIKASTLYNVLNEYAFLIDFQRDLHVNDKFIFVLDTSTDEDGDVLSENILYVNLILSGKNYEIFNFNNRFYDRKGRSIERSLLKTPVDGARMSSKFNPKRKHPILGYTKAHLGVDLAVPSGTPIYASGDGVITRKTYNSAYGNYIEIRHNNEYSTRYAHMSKFANNLKVGQKIRQRQVIGYVGMTGLATGPHLHYEVLRHGRHINPSTVKATVRKTLNKQ
jgi:murein DD-endopeptidase MepM/ murein hydrolase activator NlpD